MASTINADTGVVSGITGIIQTADATGNLTLQANGVSILTINTSNSVGIRTSTPDCELNILATPQTVSYSVSGNSTTAGTDLHISGADGANTRITQDAFGTGAYVAFTGRSSRGTAATPTQTQSGDTIAQFTGRGFSNGSLQFGNASTGRLDVVAAENFTDTSRATNVQIFTTATSSITPAAVATFSSGGAYINGVLSVAGNVTTHAILETATITAAAPTATTNFDIITQAVQYYTTAANANVTLNFRGSSTVTANTLLAVGQSTTVALLWTNTGTAYYPNVIQVDASNVTPKWQGGTAPTGGNANATDVYSFTIIKTAATPTYVVLASQTKFA